MKKLLKYNKFNFLNKINENSEFADMQMSLGASMGGNYGYASDPSLTVYSDGSTPYIDSYTRLSLVVNDLSKVIRNLHSSVVTDFSRNIDLFLEDLDNYKNLKILRIYENNINKIDVFISFEFNDEEFFGVYRNFNISYKEPRLDSDLFTDPRLRYIDKEYYLKLSKYIFKILTKFFIPTKGNYKILKEDFIVRNYLGQTVSIKKGSIIELKNYNFDSNNEYQLVIEYANDKYIIDKNDYYYFKYWVEKID